jgi:hypothetical protein
LPADECAANRPHRSSGHLTEGLVARGHDVTLFATGDSRTSAKLHATYPHGYWHDLNMWPWEL